MTIDKKRFEWNLNTLGQALTLLVMILGGITFYVDKNRDIREHSEWIARHEQLHRERLADVKIREGAYEERFRSIEKDVRQGEALNTQQTYRITVLEESATAANNDLKVVKDTLADLKTDTKVMLEVLKRLDNPSQKKE